MYPAQCDITLYRGDDFELLLRLRSGVWDATQKQYVPGPYVDLTGWTGQAQIRVTEDDAAVLASFAVVILDQTEILGGVHITIPHTATQSLFQQVAVWDIQLINPAGLVRTYLRGAVSIGKDVTRA